MQFYTRRRRAPAVNIVSLIDILTILLIFFVVTTTFRMPQPQVTINLPETVAAEAAEEREEPVILAVTAAGELFLNDEPIVMEELPDRVRAIQSEGKTVAMRADREAAFGKIIEITDTLRAAGLRALPAFTKPHENR
ncbi:MAG: biopolymer transporter ExbD [Verrucomicrobiia bacterium]